MFAGCSNGGGDDAAPWGIEGLRDLETQVSDLEPDPCQVVAERQVDALLGPDAEPNGPETRVTHRYCRWSFAGSALEVRYSIEPSRLDRNDLTPIEVAPQVQADSLDHGLFIDDGSPAYSVVTYGSKGKSIVQYRGPVTARVRTLVLEIARSTVQAIDG
jgi:hypothetical protein